MNLILLVEMAAFNAIKINISSILVPLELFVYTKVGCILIFDGHIIFLGYNRDIFYQYIVDLWYS